MSIPEDILGRLPGVQVSSGGLLRRLRLQGKLQSLVLEALADELIQSEARRAGLSVTQDELQAAANDFRRRQGLNHAADAHAWLAEQGMAMGDLLENLEHELLGGKLRQHRAATEAEAHFAAYRADYERLRLAQLCVGRDDLADELACQIREDGLDLADLEARHEVRPTRGEWWRKDLVSPLAEAMATAGPGDWVGPVATDRGFLLVLVEGHRAAVLDDATRRRVEDELFAAWLSERMREAEVDLTRTGAT